MSWQPIPDFPDYEISVDGAVRSWAGRGKAVRARKPHDVTPVWQAQESRWVVRLTREGIRYLRTVANLVLLSHRPHLSPSGRVRYKDGDPQNIHLSNLEWKNEAPAQEIPNPADS